MTASLICPRCEQDWIRPYRFKADGTAFALCTECDSFWWPHDVKEIHAAQFLDDVVSTRPGEEGNPWQFRVWADVIEPVVKDT